MVDVCIKAGLYADAFLPGRLRQRARVARIDQRVGLARGEEQRRRIGRNPVDGLRFSLPRVEAKTDLA